MKLFSKVYYYDNLSALFLFYSVTLFDSINIFTILNEVIFDFVTCFSSQKYE